jgi:hypothetical protein
MTQRKRLWFVLFSLVAIVAIVILAGGVSTLDLEHHRRRLPAVSEEEEFPARPLPAVGIFSLLFRVLFIVSGALLPFAIIYYLVSPEARKQVLRNLLIMLGFLLPLYLMSRARSEVSEVIDETPVPPPASREVPLAPELSFGPTPSRWLVLAANVGVALLLAALLVGLAWAVWRRKRRPSAPLDRLAEEAQQAVDAIEAGADLKDTVTRCYFEMMQVLKEERGLRRQRAMTPREFERRLEEVGIPTTQVRRLTRLFEQVRYGDKHLGQQEERQAVISLTSIVRFCRSAS